jgi:NADPH2:quinone reductase
MTTTVQAARLHGHGQPLAIEEVPLAAPQDGEVVVELAFAGVNPVDRYVAAGRVAPDAPLPRTIGGEGAGLLDGRPVLLAGGGLGTARDGTFARAVTCPSEAVIELPDGFDLATAACLGVAGLTAWNVVVDKAAVGPDDRVLVLGAGGGVGLPIVSLAASTGATVWGQVGRSERIEAVRSAGAARVLITAADALAHAARSLAPTVVIDPLGGSFTPAALAVLAPNGRLVVFGTSAGAEVSFNLQSLYRQAQTIVGYAGMAVPPQARRQGLQAALGAVAEGRMRIPIGATVALAEVNRAFDLLAERNVTGKVVLDLRPA